MNRIVSLALAIFAPVIVIMLGHGPALAQALANERPNILLIMTDDQGYGDIGAHGNPYLRTPNMERIGAEGVEMPTFVTYPNCSATRAGLLTGRYPYRTGVVAVTHVDYYMNESEVTLAEVLGANGYATGIFGKWHLGDAYPMNPGNQGFDEVLVHRAGGIGAGNAKAGPPGNSYYDPILEHNGMRKQFKGYVDDIFASATIDFIAEKAKGDAPFFAYYATNLPHFPLDVPDSRADRFRAMGLHEDNALVFGMIENIDANVGRLLDQLDALGIAENTIVIFLSDNGPRTRRTKNDTYPDRFVANLRGTKTSVYDNGIRVPFYVRWPARLPAGSKATRMGAMIDIMPTLLEMTGIAAPEGVTLDGQSLWSHWQGAPAPELAERKFFLQLHYGDTPRRYMHFAVRSDSHKLVSPHDNPHGIHHKQTDADLRRQLSRLELFDMAADPSERINVIGEEKQLADEYLLAYEDWFTDVTEERAAKGVQRIHLGTPQSRSVYLSRFEWGGPRVFSENALGHYQVRTEAGRYRISAEMPEVAKDSVAYLRYGDVQAERAMPAGSDTVVFDGVQLPAGEGNLHIYVREGRLPEGPHFVTIDRLD